VEETPTSPVPELIEDRWWLRMRWSWSLVVGFTIIQTKISLIVGVFFGIWAVTRHYTPDEMAELVTSTNTQTLTVYAIVELLVLVVALIAATGFYPKPIGLTWRGADHSLLLLVPLMATMSWIVWQDPDVSLAKSLHSPWLGSVIVFCALVGITEEVVFRGLLVGILGGGRMPIFAALGSAAFFGLVHILFTAQMFHVEGWLRAWTIFGLAGVPFALVYLRTGSILGIAIVHAAWDVIVIGSQGLLEQPEHAQQVGASTFVLPAAVAAAYLAWYALSDAQVRAQLLRPRFQPRTSVDWDALAEDEILNPWVARQLRQASSE
jgi:membrane protease YdiL (CAAX protease family)